MEAQQAAVEAALEQLDKVVSDQIRRVLEKVEALFAEGHKGKLPHRVALALAWAERPLTCREVAEIVGETHVKVHQALGYFGKKAGRTGLEVQVQGSQKKKTYQLHEVKNATTTETPYHGESQRNIKLTEVRGDYEGEVHLLQKLPINAEWIVNNATFISLTPLELKILQFLLSEAKEGNAVRVSSLVSDLGIKSQDYERLRKKVNKNSMRTGLHVHSVTRGAQYTGLSFLSTKGRFEVLDGAEEEDEGSKGLSLLFDEALPFDEKEARKKLHSRLPNDVDSLARIVVNAQAAGELTSIAKIVEDRYGQACSYHKKMKKYGEVRVVISETQAMRARRGWYLRVTDRRRIEFVTLRRPDFKIGERIIKVDENPELLVVAQGHGAYAEMAAKRIAEGHFPLIRFIAKSITPDKEMWADLMQEGIQPIYRGIRRFDPAHGKFLGYVGKGIERAMRRSLAKRKTVRQAESTQAKIHEVNFYRRRLSMRYNIPLSEVTAEMIAPHMELPVPTVKRIILDEEFSLQSTANKEGGERDVPSIWVGDPIRNMDMRRIKGVVRSVLADLDLSDRDRIIVEKRLMDGDSRQADLAPEFGVGRTQVSNLEIALRQRLAEIPELQQAFADLKEVNS